ncbi:nickel-dependent hydrogenase large subunit [Desulfococcaceae bacterium HSG8]|nr:nickel-dependent hydrogenase large subunit [Desulfococcaceae bacterium HSG8]
MATIKIVDPVSRIEGHLKLEIEIDQGKITDAKASGTLFRGFENLLIGRVPEDAPLLTQRICGVCPVSHGQASVLALEDVTAWKPNTNGRILRNLVLGSNFIQSHILHFYVLSVVDFAAGPSTTPWIPAWNSDMRSGLDGVAAHLTSALDARRQAHEMGAIFGAKLPHAATYVPGGLTPEITSEKISNFQNYLDSLITFIDNVYIPDVESVGVVYPDYASIGAGPENLLAYGVFEEADQTRFFRAGYMKKGDSAPSADINTSDITEHVTNSWYVQDSGLSPSVGKTDPLYPKGDAYSWVKSPRLSDILFEVGPLARMKVSGNYTGGISVLDRHKARALEASKIAHRMKEWLGEISSGSGYDDSFSQGTGSGEGLTEAPRGALGHWVSIGSDGKISHYQVITPTCWNASPRDDLGVRGPLEQALIGTPILDESQPIEAIRVVHSFDPCLACAVHVMRPDGRPVKIDIPAMPG